MRPVLTTLLILVPLVIAGCIQLPEDAADDTRPFSAEEPTPPGATMTARETVSDEVGPCTESGVPLVGSDDSLFCAKRTVHIAGDLVGFNILETSLTTFNGDVEVARGEGGKWRLEAILTTKGQSEQEARGALDDITFEWAHEESGRHFIYGKAEKTSRDDRYAAAELRLAVPADLALRLAATTSNGDVAAAGPTDGLALTTSNGDVDVDADVTQASLTTSNGDVAGHLRPTADGRVTATTSNGRIQLDIVESSEHGYRIEGSTSNGEVDYELRDGEEGPCPGGSEYYTPPCSHRTFETDGYARRAIRTELDLATSNGDIDVRRA